MTLAQPFANVRRSGVSFAFALGDVRPDLPPPPILALPVGDARTKNIYLHENYSARTWWEAQQTYLMAIQQHGSFVCLTVGRYEPELSCPF